MELRIPLIILTIPEVGFAATVALLELVAAQTALLVAHFALHSGEASVVLFATFTLAMLASFPAFFFGAGRRRGRGRPRIMVVGFGRGRGRPRITVIPAVSGRGRGRGRGRPRITVMLATSFVTRASIAFHLALVKNTLGVRRAGRLITAIPIRLPHVLITLLLGVLGLFLAIIKAIKALVKLQMGIAL